MKLKESSSKFSGDLGECWAEYVYNYEGLSRDYFLTPCEKLQYLHNLLQRDALRFYLSTVYPKAGAY